MYDCYDTIIIGGGPVGLFGAYYAGLRDMSVKLIDSRAELGGQISAIYPEKWVYDIPGIPAIRGKDLFRNLKKQFEPYNIPVSLNEEVTLIRKNRNNILCITTKSMKVFHAKTAILCVGMGAHMPRKLAIDNMQDFEGKGIHYGVKSLDEFRNKKILVLGGGDSALDLALTVSEVSSEISLAHRSDRFNAHEETVKKLYSSNIEIKTFSELIGIEGDNTHLRKVFLRNKKTSQVTEMNKDEIIVAIGLLFNLEIMNEWGIEMENNCIRVDDKRETSIPGLFAAGDICTYPAKMKLIGAGTTEIMQAIHNSKVYIQEKFPYL